MLDLCPARLARRQRTPAIIAGARFQTDAVMVGIIIIASTGVAMTELLRLIERRFERWRPSVGG